MNYEVGSMWRKWDLHVHTPESILNNQFGSDWDVYFYSLVTKAIKDNIYVIGVTDYFSIEGYKKIKQILADDNKINTLFVNEINSNPDYIDKVKSIYFLPNIEMRLNNTVEIFPNRKNSKIQIHVIFSDDIKLEDIEENFLHQLKFLDDGSEKSLTKNNIIKYGRKLIESGLGNSDNPIFNGYNAISVDFEEIVRLIKMNFKGKALIVGVEEDITKISWNDQCSGIRKNIYSRCDAFFTSNEKSIKWFQSKECENTIGSKKACIWGSDAHEYTKMFEPDLNRFCWIKADTTFLGLKESIFTFENRIYIGSKPTEYSESLKRERFSLKNIIINKNVNAINKTTWFNMSKPLELNPYMITIIGNKGSGKSALADIISYLSNSHNMNYASFLNQNRFLNLKTKYGQDYNASINFWGNGGNIVKNFLSNEFNIEDLEKVQFLPQRYIEEVCNDLGDKFQKEIDEVIFSYIPPEYRLDANNLKELITKKTISIYEKYLELKNNLELVNTQISTLEEKETNQYYTSINNKLLNQRIRLNNHESLKPEEVKVPTELEKDEFSRLELSISNEIERNEKEIIDIQNKLTDINSKINSIQQFLAKINEFEKYGMKLCWEFDDLRKKLELEPNIKIITTKIDTSSLNSKLGELLKEAEKFNELLFNPYEDINIDINTIEFTLDSIIKEAKKNKSLYIQNKIFNEFKKEVSCKTHDNAKKYLQYVEDLKQWEKEWHLIKGDIPEANGCDSIIKYEKEIEFLKTKLKGVLLESREKRKDIIESIYDLHIQRIKIYEEIYEPIQERIDSLINFGDDKIEFSANIICDKNVVDNLISLIDQRIKGPFMGISEGYQILRNIFAETNFNDKVSVVSMVDKVFSLIEDDSTKNNYFKSKNSFYNILSRMDYLHPQFQLTMSGKKLTELSPGERGIVLLVFYLALSKNNIPLIIDQPEDNLDNQSVYKKLVPCIKNAKKNRQIIVVSHNPNIAVACDSEQVIYTSIDKKTNEISYISGSIENPMIKNKIVDVLEGTKPAFELRKIKYE